VGVQYFSNREDVVDKHFRVEVVTATQNPAEVIWYGAHQCVAEGFALDDKPPQNCGEAIVRHLLPVGHWSPFEHAAITFNIGGFSHRVMQQFTRSRMISPSVQSFRYTGERVATLGADIEEALIEKQPGSLFVLLEAMPELAARVDSLFYQRPPGEYRDRHGKSVVKGEIDFIEKRCRFAQMARYYYEDITDGEPHESAAGCLPMDTRQDWVATFNVRSLCAFFDRRTPKDAQLEIRQLSDLMWPHFESWLPESAAWYRENRWSKNKLAP
jgi:thymidylate synthase (FAD)